MRRDKPPKREERPGRRPKKEKDRDRPRRSHPCLRYLSVIMLGFIVTRSVLVPTSAAYFSLMGGMLHLQKEKTQVQLS